MIKNAVPLALALITLASAVAPAMEIASQLYESLTLASCSMICG